MTTGSHSEPCINWPCAKGAGHAGPCGTSRDELTSKKRFPFYGHDDGLVIEGPDTGFKQTPMTPAQLAAREPPSRIGPTEPDDTMVICPVCTSQFRAIPLDVQRENESLRNALTRILNWAPRLTI